MSSTPGGSAGDSRRRAEIEAKRAKLAELKRAREERSSRLLANRTPAPGTSEVGTPASTSSSTRKDIDDLVASLTRTPKTSVSAGPAGSAFDGSPQRGSTSGAAQGRPGSSSDFGGSEAGMRPSSTTFRTDEGASTGVAADGEAASRPPPDLVDVSTELFEFPQKERVYYTKEVQTMASGDDDEEDGERSGAGVGTDAHAQTSAATEAAIRKRILAEQAELAEKDRQLKHEEEELERQIQEELRIMSPQEVAAIFGTSDFSDFVETSSKIVERALTDAYDYMKDYTMAGSSSGDDALGPAARRRDELKLARCFYDEKLCKGRSVTAVDWSSKHPELVVVSYSRSSAVLMEDAASMPDGLVLVWNLHLLDRPEFVFQAQTDVLSVCFSPFHPNLIVGGTYSGQILIWDTRSKAPRAAGGAGAAPTAGGGILPSLKTPLSSTAGHTHPVYSLSVVGTQNANHLITASTDGLVCSWMLPDMLARPVDSLQLLNQAHPKTDEVSVTSVGFMQGGRVETNAFWLGTEEGSVWMAARFDRAGAKAGLQGGGEGAHSAPVTGLDFHRASGGGGTGSTPGADFSDLLLTSSMDWTAKLWRVSMGGSNTSASTSSTRPTASTSSAGPSLTPLLTFDDYSDYVLCAQWHPTHPSLFATADASGILHVHDLSRDVERPVAQVRFDGNGGVVAGSAATAASSSSSPMGLNKLAWDKGTEPRKLACGGTDGRLYVLDVGGLAAVSGGGEEWVEMGRLVSRAASGAASAAGAVTNGLGSGRYGVGR